MALGILTNIAAIYAENNLNQTQASLQNTLTQLSSGSRINSGADDAAGLSVVDGLQANVSALTQSSQNASDGIGLLQTADGALSQVTNLLNRAVTLATEAANGTLNSSQVGSANAEYQNILTEIGDIGSSTNFNGNSVFTSTSKTVFVSDGTTSGSDSYNEVVGTLSDGSVGETQGATVLSLPTPTTPTATTTVQSAVAVTTPTLTSINPTPVAAAATVSATTSLTPVTTGNTTDSATQIIGGSGVQAASGGNAYVASTVTAAAASGNAFSATDTYSGVIGVRLSGSTTNSTSLYTASVAPGSSLQTLVTALNNSFGYNPASGTASTSGLQAQDVNNALVITTAPNATGTVQIDAPTSSLQVNPEGAGAYGSVGFSGTATTVATANAQTAASATFSIGTSETSAAGSFSIETTGGTLIGTVSFGGTGTTTTASEISSTLTSQLAAFGFTGSYNSSSGYITITAGSTANSSFQIVNGTGSAGAANGPLESGTGSNAAVGSGVNVSSSGYAASTATITGSGYYSGTLNVQLAGSGQTYSASIASGSTTAQAVAALNNAFGSSSASSIGTSGLVAVASNNNILIESAVGAGQVVLNNPSTLTSSGTSSGTYTAVSLGVTPTSVGYTGSAAEAAASNASAVALGTAAVTGTLNIYAGNSGSGTAIGTIDFGTAGTSSSIAGAGTGTNASPASGSVQAAIAAAFTGAVTSNTNANTVTYAGGASTSLAGYSATYNTQSGLLTINGPSNGNSFSLGQATTGNSELQTATVSTTLTAGTGVIAGSGTLYSGTVNFGNGSSYVISSPATASALATAGSGLSAAATAAGLTVADSNNQLVFTSTNSPSTPPTVTVTNGAASTDAYTASSVSFAPTSGSGSSGTYSGQFSIALNGTSYSTSFAAGTTGNAAAAILNGLNPGSSGSGVFGNSGLTAAFTNGELTITGPTPSAANALSTDQITVNSTNDLAGAASSTQTLTNTNAAAGTTYTGTISFGAVGTTAAGSFVIGSGSTGTTAAAIAAAFNTATGSATTGITASVNSSNELVFSGPSTGSAQGSGPGVTLTGVTATAPTVTTYSASTASFAANSGGTFSGVLTVGTTATGQISSTIAAGTTLANLVTQLNNQYTQAGVSSSLIASAGTGSQAGELIISGATPNSSATASADTLIFSQATGANTLTATSATSVDGGAGSGVNFTSSTVDQLTASSAQSVLTAVTSAINDVAYQRGLIGADVNELTAASNVASAESVNLTSAQSTVQQTDYGQATSDLAKYQVLSQTGISALAQANSVQQEVLKLLQ